MRNQKQDKKTRAKPWKESKLRVNVKDQMDNQKKLDKSGKRVNKLDNVLSIYIQ